MKTIELKQDTILVSATTPLGSPILTEDDGMGPLWAWSDNPYGGVSAIVRAQSYEKALEIVYDLLPTIPEDEVHEAYGFDCEGEFQAAISRGEQPELIEGYHDQANRSGTGIVSVDHCERMWKLDHENAKYAVRLKVRHLDDVLLDDLFD